MPITAGRLESLPFTGFPGGGVGSVTASPTRKLLDRASTPLFPAAAAAVVQNLDVPWSGKPDQLLSERLSFREQTEPLKRIDAEKGSSSGPGKARRISFSAVRITDTDKSEVHPARPGRECDFSEIGACDSSAKSLDLRDSLLTRNVALDIAAMDGNGTGGDDDDPCKDDAAPKTRRSVKEMASSWDELERMRRRSRLTTKGLPPSFGEVKTAPAPGAKPFKEPTDDICGGEPIPTRSNVQRMVSAFEANLRSKTQRRKSCELEKQRKLSRKSSDSFRADWMERKFGRDFDGDPPEAYWMECKSSVRDCESFSRSMHRDERRSARDTECLPRSHWDERKSARDNDYIPRSHRLVERMPARSALYDEEPFRTRWTADRKSLRNAGDRPRAHGTERNYLHDIDALSSRTTQVEASRLSVAQEVVSRYDYRSMAAGKAAPAEESRKLHWRRSQRETLSPCPSSTDRQQYARQSEQVAVGRVSHRLRQLQGTTGTGKCRTTHAPPPPKWRENVELESARLHRTPLLESTLRRAKFHDERNLAYKASRARSPLADVVCGGMPRSRTPVMGNYLPSPRSHNEMEVVYQSRAASHSPHHRHRQRAPHSGSKSKTSEPKQTPGGGRGACSEYVSISREKEIEELERELRRHRKSFSSLTKPAACVSGTGNSSKTSASDAQLSPSFNTRRKTFSQTGDRARRHHSIYRFK